LWEDLEGATVSINAVWKGGKGFQAGRQEVPALQEKDEEVYCTVIGGGHKSG